MEEDGFTQDKAIIKRIRNKYRSLSGLMDERMRRQWAASEADDLGWGGVTVVALATGLARNTIMGGARELESRRAHPRAEVSSRIREEGGGRKPLTENDPGLLTALEALVDPVTRGHPESPLRWTCKSTGTLAAELKRQQHPVSDRTVAALLKAAGYSLQANLNHPVEFAEHGNTANPVRPRDRADLTARRVRGRSFGKTEEAKASGNALDRPTSVRSEMARTPVESLAPRKANDGRRLSADASRSCCPRQHDQNDRRPVLPSGVRLVGRVNRAGPIGQARTL
jgi:hypothetical protein